MSIFREMMEMALGKTRSSITEGDVLRPEEVLEEGAKGKSTPSIVRHSIAGVLPWNPADWTAVDDRVRGGMSQSYMDISPAKDVARFHGVLDIKTLGGAGFASQQTTREDPAWDLSAWDGVVLEIIDADDKEYAFTLATILEPPDLFTGRVPATYTYQYNFTLASEREKAAERRKGRGGDDDDESSSYDRADEKAMTVLIPWTELKATYRGRRQEDAPPLDTCKIRRMSFLMRSYFGEQEGPFSLSVQSIAAFSKTDKAGEERSL